MTCPNRFITNLLLALGCSNPLSAQNQASGLRDAALLRASLQGGTAIQSKQPPAQPEVDIRIAHPEYNAIGRVDALVTEGISHGTGVLINECLVLTNRHVVEGHRKERSKEWEAWDQRVPGDPMPVVPEYPDFVDLIGKKVKFRVGYTGDRNHPFAHEIKGIVVGTGGQGFPEYDPAQDWAIIKLDQSIGKKRVDGGVGSIPAIFADEAKVRSCPSPEIAGFPGDRTEEIMTHYQNCPFYGAASGQFGFERPVKHGESGSPVLCRFPDGSFKIISLVRTSVMGGHSVGAIDFTFDREAIKKVILQFKDTCP